MVTRSPILRLLVSPLLVRSSCSPRSPPVLPSSPPQPGTHESAQSKPRKLRSEIWIDMEPIYGQGKVVKACCKHCYEVFSASRNSGNSHIRRHLAICEPRLKMVEMVENLKSSIPSIEAARLSNWKFDPKKTRAELVRLIVLHELPFSLVEYEGFRSYSASLNPLAESVSRTTIKENCIQAFKNHRATIRDELQDSNCRFSLTADIWTCHNTTSYIVVTCHYIDANWKVQKKIIKFCWIETPHDGFNIYSVMLKAIRFYGIEDKLCSITLDNASVNKTMMDLLKGHLVKMNMLHSSGDLFHVRCAAHVINLIVKDGLQEIDGAIYRIRESIRYIKGSPSRWEKFEEIIRDLRIKCKSRPSLDVATRWNSTCDMLESALPFKDAFIELENLDSNYIYCPRPEEWHKAAVVCKLLKVFKKATKIVSGSKYPTANLYFHQIWNLKQVLDEKEINPNRTLLSMVLEMQNKFEKYWDISYLANCIPVILDPRFKFGFIEFRLKQVYGNSAGDHIAKVDKTLRNLFNGYSSEMGNTNSATQGETSTAGGSNSWSDWFRHISAQNNQVSGELDRYLRDDLFPCDDESFDILHWWKVHASQYPVVACMARDLLAVPASTVASESAFSTSERIVNDHRTRLANNTVEALICFQDWLRSAGSSYLDIISITTPDSNIEDVS